MHCVETGPRVTRNDGALSSAEFFFEGLKKLCEEGQINEALQAVQLRNQHGSSVSTNIFYWLLQGCTSKKDLASGRKVHRLILRNKLESSAFLGSHLIRMFASCGSLVEANEIFSKLPHPNMFAWGEIISAHAKLGKSEQAIKLYHHMRKSGVSPDGHIFVAVLQACASAVALSQGELIHAHIIESGLELNIFVVCSLVDMYVQCGNLKYACRAFERLPDRNVVIWNALIAGYARHGNDQDAGRIFKQMKLEGMEPNRETWNAMISGSAQNRRGDEALCLLQQMQDEGMQPNCATWNAIITGYTQHGYCQEALQVFQKMQQEGMVPNYVTFISILKACSSIAALEHGKLIHAHAIESGCEWEAVVGNTIIKLYSQCGSLQDARGVFNRLPERDTVTWNAMISAYAHHSNYSLALRCFEDMLQEGAQPDDVTFTCLLSACSHLGLVDEGCHYLKLMTEVHGIAPVYEHYNCVVDLLGRTGRLNEAIDLLQTMPFQSNRGGWRSLLSHSKSHGNAALGRRCFDNVVAMDGKDSAVYVLMSNIYANTGMLE